MLPYDMFDAARSAAEARRAEKLASIYHRGQQQAWAGKNVLQELIAKHGGLHIREEHRAPVRRIFSVLMWGELAAWKISAQLADRLEPLEHKMAATSQVFDEARHFYVMHDYLAALNTAPDRPNRHTEAALQMVLKTRDLSEKLMGMQMMFEPVALTIFKIVRELEIEPVLSDLLPYFEKDEARHVGLGVQSLPELIDDRPAAAARVTVFQLRLIGHILRSLKVLAKDFEALGMSARDVLERGVLKQQLASEMMQSEMAIDLRVVNELAKRGVLAVCDLVFPVEDSAPLARLRRAARTLRHGVAMQAERA